MLVLSIYTFTPTLYFFISLKNLWKNLYMRNVSYRTLNISDFFFFFLKTFTFSNIMALEKHRASHDPQQNYSGKLGDCFPTFYTTRVYRVRLLSDFLQLQHTNHISKPSNFLIFRYLYQILLLVLDSVCFSEWSEHEGHLEIVNPVFVQFLLLWLFATW